MLEGLAVLVVLRVRPGCDPAQLPIGRPDDPGLFGEGLASLHGVLQLGQHPVPVFGMQEGGPALQVLLEVEVNAEHLIDPG